MPVKIEIVDLVPENKLVETVQLFAASDADIVTVVNDNKGTFTLEATFFGASPPASTITLDGKMSTFGGPNDPGVGAGEGLSLFDAGDVAANPDLFLAAQPPGTTGLAKRLDPQAKYLACRWNLAVTPKSFLKMATTLVKVTNPANGRSENARPADTGPAVFTRRVADLSLGLATALGLPTDGICHIEIPTPAGAQLPAGTGVDVDVDPIEINDTVFPKDMTHSLVVMTASGNTSFWVAKVIGQNEGGQTLMRQVGNNPPKMLRSDTVILPIQADAQVPDVVAGELNKAVQKDPNAPTGPAGPAPGAGDDINAKMFAAAQGFVGHSTHDVPLTDHGNLACAWAVNEVTRLALSKPISSDGGKNGLSTVGIFDVLQAHHTKLNSAGDATRGTIIIAPTEEKNHGHVGIVGTIDSSANDTKVFSNKSVPGVFLQNFTIGSFTSHFRRNGLQVLFFNLKADQFTAGV